MPMAKEKYLHDALKKLVATYGESLYNNKRMINYISDYYSFDPLALYNVMKTLIADGYAGKLLETGKKGDWKLFVTQSIAKVQKNYGFAPVYVNYCFQSLAFGVGLYPYINKRLLDEVEGKSPSVSSSSSPSQSSFPTQSSNQTAPGPSSSSRSSITRQNKTSRTNTRSSSPSNQSNNSGNSTSFPPFPGFPNRNSQTSPQKQNNMTKGVGCSGCSGCFDSMTSTYVIIIIILWIMMQCEG